MNTVKTGFKFNKKVYIIPFDKFDSVMESMGNSDVQKTTINNSDAGKDTGQRDVSYDVSQEHSHTQKQQQQQQETATPHTPQPDSSLDKLRQVLTPTQFNNAMAIGYMVGFEPGTTSDYTTSLIYTQKDSSKPPSNIVELYHLLDKHDVPLHLIGNTTLQSRMKEMSHLTTDASDEASDDTDDASADETDEDILKRAWIYYTKAQDRKRKQAAKHGKRNAKKLASENIKLKDATTPQHNNKPSTSKYNSHNQSEVNDWIDLF